MYLGTFLYLYAAQFIVLYINCRLSHLHLNMSRVCYVGGLGHVHSAPHCTASKRASKKDDLFYLFSSLLLSLGACFLSVMTYESQNKRETQRGEEEMLANCFFFLFVDLVCIFRFFNVARRVLLSLAFFFCCFVWSGVLFWLFVCNFHFIGLVDLQNSKKFECRLWLQMNSCLA